MGRNPAAARSSDTGDDIMLKTGKLILATLVAALALPAAAGSWPNVPGSKGRPWKPSIAAADAPTSLEQYRAFPSEEYRGKKAFARDSAPVREAAATKDGFEFVGGDTGWQLSQHKYVRSGGRFVHSDECDHVVRTARAPSAEEVEAGRTLSPGA
jgi:hypothetical protein